MENFNELKWYKDTIIDILKPCPLCNSKVIKINVPDKDNKETVKCLTCGLTLSRSVGIGVVRIWNDRTKIKIK